MMLLLIGSASFYWNYVYYPENSTKTALAAVNGSNKDVIVTHQLHNNVNLALGAVTLLVAVFCFWPPRGYTIRKNSEEKSV